MKAQGFHGHSWKAKQKQNKSSIEGGRKEGAK
jgi:hypothetical protein